MDFHPEMSNEEIWHRLEDLGLKMSRMTFYRYLKKLKTEPIKAPSRAPEKPQTSPEKPQKPLGANAVKCPLCGHVSYLSSNPNEFPGHVCHKANFQNVHYNRHLKRWEYYSDGEPITVSKQ